MESPELREFKDLSPVAFQHPLDIQATTNLKKVPLLTPLLKAVSGNIFEKQMRLMSIANSVRLGPNQGASVYQKFVKAAAILDIPELPEIYVSNRYVINAYAFGIKNYQITLFSGLIDALTEAELMAVIGHELGHVKCEHMLYKTMAYIIRFFGINFLQNLLPAGTGMIASLALLLAILEWERQAELSCDRAALLVVQDQDVVASTLSKLAGGSEKILPEINLEGILKQAEEYEDSSGGFIEQLFKVNIMLAQTHPFPVLRAKEIIKWSGGEQYQNILNGDYARESAGAPAAAEAKPVGPVSKVCPNCKKLSTLSAVTCVHCGTGLGTAHRVCTNCHIRVFPNWQTCPGCGAQLNTTAEEEAVPA
jgi:Zn-dependent protease with chaperone function